MTPEQIKDLLIEWSIYSPQQQLAITLEYKEIFGEIMDEKHWLNFLKEKLEIEAYWKKIGLT
jgi:hypothetical protein